MSKTARTLAESTADHLRQQIASGVFRAGDMLPAELALAGHYGVSRTVMREAVARLRAEGLVSGSQGRGNYVALDRPQQTFRIATTSYGDPIEIRRILELRLGFEVEAAGLAARNRTARDLKAIKSSLSEMATAIRAGDVRRGVDADIEFHRAICDATHSHYYPQLFAAVSEFLRRNIEVCRNRSWNSKLTGRGAIAQKEHTAISKAIEAGQADLARSAARSHLECTLERLDVWAREDQAGQPFTQ